MEKKVAVILADGFEEAEALVVVDILRRSGIICDMISIHKEIVLGSHRIKVLADKLFDEIDKNSYDMIFLPGGHVGANNLRDFLPLVEWIKDFNEKGKYLAAICAAPIVFAKANIVNGKNITSYPDDIYREEFINATYIDDDGKMDEMVVVDDNIITSRGPATVFPFAYKLVDILGKDSKNLKVGMLYNDFCKEIKDNR